MVLEPLGDTARINIGAEAHVGVEILRTSIKNFADALGYRFWVS